MIDEKDEKLLKALHFTIKEVENILGADYYEKKDNHDRLDAEFETIKEYILKEGFNANGFEATKDEVIEVFVNKGVPRKVAERNVIKAFKNNPEIIFYKPETISKNIDDFYKFFTGNEDRAGDTSIYEAALCCPKVWLRGKSFIYETADKFSEELAKEGIKVNPQVFKNVVLSYPACLDSAKYNNFKAGMLHFLNDFKDSKGESLFTPEDIADIFARNEAIRAYHLQNLKDMLDVLKDFDIPYDKAAKKYARAAVRLPNLLNSRASVISDHISCFVDSKFCEGFISKEEYLSCCFYNPTLFIQNPSKTIENCREFFADERWNNYPEITLSKRDFFDIMKKAPAMLGLRGDTLMERFDIILDTCCRGDTAFTSAEKALNLIKERPDALINGPYKLSACRCYSHLHVLAYGVPADFRIFTEEKDYLARKNKEVQARLSEKGIYPCGCEGMAIMKQRSECENANNSRNIVNGRSEVPLIKFGCRRDYANGR